MPRHDGVPDSGHGSGGGASFRRGDVPRSTHAESYGAPGGGFNAGATGGQQGGTSTSAPPGGAAGVPSLAVRLMQVAGEYELERKRQWQRAEARIAELQEARRTAERLAWSQGKQIEALSRQLTKAQHSAQEAEAARAAAVATASASAGGGDASSALVLEVLGLRLELAEKSLLLDRLAASRTGAAAASASGQGGDSDAWRTWGDACLLHPSDLARLGALASSTAGSGRGRAGAGAAGVGDGDDEDGGVMMDPNVAAVRSAALVGCAADDKERLLLGGFLLQAPPPGTYASPRALPLAGGDLALKEELLAAAERGLEGELGDMLRPLPTAAATVGTADGEESKAGASAARDGPLRRRVRVLATLSHALRKAAWGGHVGIVRRLLELGCAIDTRSIEDGKARTAVHGAALSGHEDIIRMLVAHASAAVAEQQKEAAAASDGQAPARPVDFDDTDADLCTALHLAASANRVSVVKYLLLNGADPNRRNAADQTPLEVAQAAPAPTCVRLLSDKNMLFWNSSVRANKEYNEKRFEEAMASYTVALELAPDCSMSTSSRDLATLHYNRARAAYRLGQHCRAVEDCSAALDRDDSYRNALAQRAECYMSLFDFPRAVRDFQALLDADPSDRQWARRLLDARAMKDMTHYQVLGLARSADATAIKKAYRQHCLKWHPDKHHSCAEDQKRSTTAFRRINEANEVLTDSYKRMMYDMEIRNTPSSGIQSDGFDRWYKKEREREAERAKESRRLRDLELARRKARDLDRDRALAAHEALQQHEQRAMRRVAERRAEVDDAARRAEAAAADARRQSTARAQAAVSRAESHVRSVQALAQAHTAALDSSRRQVMAAKSRAARAATAAASTAGSTATSNSTAATYAAAAGSPGRHSRRKSREPLTLPRDAAAAAVHPPPLPSPLASGATAHTRDDAPGGALGIPAGIVGERAAAFTARTTGTTAGTARPAARASTATTATTAAAASATAPSAAGNDTGGSGRSASGGSRHGRRGSSASSTTSRGHRGHDVGSGSHSSGSHSSSGVDGGVDGGAAGGDVASAYFSNAPSTPTREPRGVRRMSTGGNTSDEDPVTEEEAQAEADRRASVERARNLARRVEAEKLKELERLRLQQERDAQYERAAARVVQLERERARRRDAERRRMQQREAEFKQQVERELALDREGVLGSSGDASSELDDSRGGMAALLLSDSDDGGGSDVGDAAVPGSAVRGERRRHAGVSVVFDDEVEADVDGEGVAGAASGSNGNISNHSLRMDFDDAGAHSRSRNGPSGDSGARLGVPGDLSDDDDAYSLGSHDGASDSGIGLGLGGLDDDDSLDLAAVAAAEARQRAGTAARGDSSDVSGVPRRRSRVAASPASGVRGGRYHRRVDSSGGDSASGIGAASTSTADGEEDQVMREVERLYRRERHRVAAEAALASSPTSGTRSPHGGSGGSSRDGRAAWEWSAPPEVNGRSSSRGANAEATQAPHGSAAATDPYSHGRSLRKHSNVDVHLGASRSRTATFKFTHAPQTATGAAAPVGDSSGASGYGPGAARGVSEGGLDSPAPPSPPAMASPTHSVPLSPD